MDDTVLTAVNVLLQVLTLSVLATDRFQTRHWCNGTEDDPVFINGYGVAESNPMIYDYQSSERYFDAYMAGVTIIPRMLSPPVSASVLLTIFIAEYLVVHKNNRGMKSINGPQYYVIEYRFIF